MLEIIDWYRLRGYPIFDFQVCAEVYLALLWNAHQIGGYPDLGITGVEDWITEKITTEEFLIKNEKIPFPILTKIQRD